MKQVTSKEFYAVIGPKDVITSVLGRYDDPTGYRVEFKTRCGDRLVGVVHDKPTDEPRRYAPLDAQSVYFLA